MNACCLFCGNTLKRKNRSFCQGCKKKWRESATLIECECGCNKLASLGRRFISGHNKPSLGRKASEETKKRLSESHKGHVHSDEHKRKISDSEKGRVHSAESIRKSAESRRGGKRSEESKARMSSSHLGNRHSLETKEKMSASQKLNWDNSPDRVPYGRISRWQRESYPERKFRLFLEKAGFVKDIHYVQEYPIGRFSIDFAFPLQQLAIEIDGSQHLKDYRVVSDRKRDEILSGKGWQTMRIPVSILNDVIDGYFSIDFDVDSGVIRERTVISES